MKPVIRPAVSADLDAVAGIYTCDVRHTVITFEENPPPGAACAGTHVRQLIAVIADAGTDTSAAPHRRYGFRDAGRLAAVGHKHERWIDTLLMQRTFGQQPTANAPEAGPSDLHG
ncbi:hypothetical protein G3I55_19970 [Streptomyces sp. SID6648]|nr:hypothetical protein [Streptomyces sp. SID6648]